MKQIIVFLLILSIFLIACETENIPETPPSDAECASDTDCTTGGCSGTVCQSKDTPPMFTTCEYKEEYACYKQIDCGCVNYKCQWEKTPEFDDCVEEAKKTR